MKPLNIACIGGGTGLSTLLRGFRQYAAANDGGPYDMDGLTAIVSVSDDGGSSGKLIDEFGVLPPGDIRNCLVALAEENETISRLFEYRFNSNGDLRGHSVGNLLLIALTDLFGTFPLAIREAARALAVRGRILPVTVEQTLLCAELMDGHIVCGESNIPDRRNRAPIRRVFLKRRLENGSDSIKAYPEAVKAIVEADAVVIGPGSLYTSILPNIVVPEIADALRQSKALKVYVGNVMIEPGETDGFSLSDHVNAVRRHGDLRVDYVLANSGLASDALLRRYYKQAQQAQRPPDNSKQWTSFNDFMDQIDPPTDPRDPPERALVQTLYRPDVDDVSPAEIVQEDLIREADVQERGETLRVLRHHPLKLAAAIARLFEKRCGE